MPAITEAESFRRGVFPYEVGGVAYLGDPLKILNRMYACITTDFEALVDQFFAVPAKNETADEKNRRNLAMIQAAEALEPAVLAGFKLQPLADDGTGISITEGMNLLADFFDWQRRKEEARLAASVGAAEAVEEATDLSPAPEAVEEATDLSPAPEATDLSPAPEATVCS